MPTKAPAHPALVENHAAAGAVPGVVVICEHASNALPGDWLELGGDLGVSEATRTSHAAWDIGALGLARGIAMRLGAVLVHASLSRLVYDLNRAPDHPAAMPPCRRGRKFMTYRATAT